MEQPSIHELLSMLSKKGYADRENVTERILKIGNGIQITNDVVLSIEHIHQFKFNLSDFQKRFKDVQHKPVMEEKNPTIMMQERMYDYEEEMVGLDTPFRSVLIVNNSKDLFVIQKGNRMIMHYGLQERLYTF